MIGRQAQKGILSRGASTCTLRGTSTPASSEDGKGICCVEGYPGRLAGDEAKSDVQLMKSLGGSEKDVTR